MLHGNVRHLASYQVVPAGPDGWWHLDDEPWSWVRCDLHPDHPVWRPLFDILYPRNTGPGVRCTVCDALDAIDTAVVPSRIGADYQDTIDRCRRCGATEVGYAEQVRPR